MWIKYADAWSLKKKISFSGAWQYLKDKIKNGKAAVGEGCTQYFESELRL